MKNSCKNSWVLMASMLFLGSCTSASFDENMNQVEAEESEYGIGSYEQEIEKSKLEDEEKELAQKLKEIDVEKAVVYVDRPVYVPSDVGKIEKTVGKDAVKKSTKDSLIQPEKYVRGAMFYDFDNDFTYEIYCQAYRVTDVQLEPGEQVLEMPFLSENQVWEIGAGVSRVNNQDVQHFFLKPSMAGLTTSMIIITDRRIYHLLLKSFKDSYMSIVRWEYPNTMPFSMSSKAGFVGKNGSVKSENSFTGVDPQFLSFDYKMTYSLFKKPAWLPTLVYDDGRRTYIKMNEIVLHRESPALFNHKNELINYRVEKNLIIIDQLIDKVTLKRKNEKVTITKKNYKPDASDIFIEESEVESSKVTQTSRNLNFNFSTSGKGTYLPTTVYDDGKVTHLKMKEKALDDLPAIFDSKNNNVDYRISGNEILIDTLIDKITLRNGKNKITISNKEYKSQIKKGLIKTETKTEKSENDSKDNKTVTKSKFEGGLVISSEDAQARRKSFEPPKEKPIEVEVNYSNQVLPKNVTVTQGM